MHLTIRQLLCAAPVLLILGCNGSSGRLAIDGAVSYAGEPVKKGSLIFRPADPKSPEISAAIVDGTYKLPAQAGPKAEEYVVKISGYHMKKDPKAFVPSYLKDDPNAGMIPEQYIPKKYNDDSNQKVKFEAGKSTYDFKLEK